MIKLTNPKRSGDSAYIKICRPDGAEIWLTAGHNAKRYAKAHECEVTERAGQFFKIAASDPMTGLFAACKGRVEMMRKIRGLGAATWEPAL